MPRKIFQVVLLDVNGTLTDLAPLGHPWGRPELGERILQYAAGSASVDALLGVDFRPFTDHLRAALEVVVAEEELDPGPIERALAAAAALPARPDAAQALERLRDAGIAAVALTNSGTQAGQATLDACGLLPFLELVLGVDAVGRFKPHPSVYGYALEAVRRDPSEVALLATHAWDLAGAANAGIGTAWVRHGARAWPSVFPRPAIAGETLREVAELLAANRP